MFVFLPCATAENAPGKAEHMESPIPGLAKKKKRNLKFVNNGKFELEPQYAGLPRKTYKFWLSKRRTDYTSAGHKIIAQVLAKTVPCST